MSTAAELSAVGYTLHDTAPCSKCQTPVETWESPEGRAVLNTASHPTGPGCLHRFTCGESLPSENPLPPIPTLEEQAARAGAVEVSPAPDKD